MPYSRGLADLAPLTENGTQPRMTLAEMIPPIREPSVPGKKLADIYPAKTFIERLKDRAKEFPSDNFWKHMRENYYTPNQDIIKDYMVNSGSTFEEAMKWAVKEDAINDPRLISHPKGSFAKGLSNAWNKEMNKRELEKAGIKRVN
jgi:hypothetical protein